MLFYLFFLDHAYAKELYLTDDSDTEPYFHEYNPIIDYKIDVCGKNTLFLFSQHAISTIEVFFIKDNYFLPVKKPKMWLNDTGRVVISDYGCMSYDNKEYLVVRNWTISSYERKWHGEIQYYPISMDDYSYIDLGKCKKTDSICIFFQKINHELSKVNMSNDAISESEILMKINSINKIKRKDFKLFKKMEIRSTE